MDLGRSRTIELGFEVLFKRHDSNVDISSNDNYNEEQHSRWLKADGGRWLMMGYFVARVCTEGFSSLCGTSAFGSAKTSRQLKPHTSSCGSIHHHDVELQKDPN